MGVPQKEKQTNKTHEKKQMKNPQNLRQSKMYGTQLGSSKIKVYSNKILSQERRKISNKQPNLTTKATRERRANKTQS